MIRLSVISMFALQALAGVFDFDGIDLELQLEDGQLTENRQDIPDFVAIPTNEDGQVDPNLLTLDNDKYISDRQDNPELWAIPSNADGQVDPSKFLPKIFINVSVSEGVPEDFELTLDRATNDCGCGYSLTNPDPANVVTGRIIGGSEVNPMHSLPYQVYLQSCWPSLCGLCGATLINKRYIISAMHCIKDRGGNVASSVVATLGDHNIRQSYETNAPLQSIYVYEVIQRPDFNHYNAENDIVILKLSRDAVFNDYVQPACLPSSSYSTYFGQPAIISGWGSTGPGISDVLRQATTTVRQVSHSACRPLAPKDWIEVCTYKAGVSICMGDSGGPLMVQVDGRNTVIGVASHVADASCPTNYGQVFAKVARFLDWINANVADGWCNGLPNTGTTSAPTTAAPIGCDLSCKLGPITGQFAINGYLASCTAGVCQSLNGHDLCHVFPNPCG